MGKKGPARNRVQHRQRPEPGLPHPGSNLTEPMPHGFLRAARPVSSTLTTINKVRPRAGAVRSTWWEIHYLWSFSVSLNTTSHKSMSLLACPPVPPGKEPSLLPPNESEVLSSEKPGSFQVGFCTSVVMPRAEHVHGLPQAAPDGASEVSGGEATHTQPAAKPSP